MLTHRVSYDPARRLEVEAFDVPYRSDAGYSLLARIYRPRGAGPFPLLIDVHGGAWCKGERTQNELMDRAIATAGLVVVAIDFRLGPTHPYPASLTDINYAIRWAKAHAAEFDAAADRVGGLGSSSGGHQILLSALRPTDPAYAVIPLEEAPEVDARLAYVVACWPVIDPLARYEYAKEAGRIELVESSEGFFRSVDNMIAGNPQTLVDRGAAIDRPPVLIVQGTADGNVPMSIPERFAASYRAAGGSVDLAVFPDEPHSFGNTPGPASDRAIGLMREFIARQLAD